MISQTLIFIDLSNNQHNFSQPFFGWQLVFLRPRCWLLGVGLFMYLRIFMEHSNEDSRWPPISPHRRCPAQHIVTSIEYREHWYRRPNLQNARHEIQAGTLLEKHPVLGDHEEVQHYCTKTAYCLRRHMYSHNTIERESLLDHGMVEREHLAKLKPLQT